MDDGTGDGRDPREIAGEGVEERLARLGAAVATGEQQLGELASLERELWGSLHAARASGARERRGSHPLVGVARSWSATLAGAGETEAAARVDDLTGGLFEHMARQWAERTRSCESAGDYFEALLEASRLEHEAMRSVGEAAGRGGVSGDRAAVRAQMRAALEARPPTEGERARWTDGLVDMADDVRSAQIEIEHGPAAAHLDLAVEDLAGHLETVERGRGENRRRLLRKHRRLALERVERLLALRLENMFGPRLVGIWDRAILLAILLVLGLLVLPFVLDLTPQQLELLAWIDTAACAFFLWDFFFKAVLVRFQSGWLARHALTDFLPSLPFGLLHAGFVLRLGRAVRLLRGLRLVLPFIRVARAIGFLAHGADRMVRRYGHLLDHDVILHPTRLERARDRQARGGARPGAWRTLGKVEDLWESALARAEPEARALVVGARTEVLFHVSKMDWTARATGGESNAARQGPCAETLLERLGAIPAEEIEGELGRDFVARAARAMRAVSRSPLRWLPVFHAYVPRIPAGASDAEATARVTRRAAGRLLRHYRRSQWIADLHGTVTPAGLVGGVGTALVRRSARPAGRLLVLAALFALVRLTMLMFGVTELSTVADHIESLVGSALIVLGSVCLVLLGLGFWMQRLANDSSTYHDQVAVAQFAQLTECIRVRPAARDTLLLDQRVIGPERILFERDGGAARAEDRAALGASVESWLSAGRPARTPRTGFDAISRSALLYRDSLDGSLLNESDTRTTVQLLGNLALQRGRERSRRFTRRDEKKLARFDLERRRVLVGGPYLWFHLIAKAVTQGAARLVVDYNQHALPLGELEFAGARTRERYRRWLSRRRAHCEVTPQSDVGPADAEEDQGAGSVGLSTAFTALHFLDRSVERDDEIERRFGRAVRELLERDRRELFRRVFGSFPLHLRPAERRVLNLRTTYNTWIEGGRVVLLPFRLFGVAASLAWQALVFTGRCVREVRNPHLGLIGVDEVDADFVSASRKIDRMRGPSACESVRQRALFDAEYLGVPLPGSSRTGGAAVLEEDLDFLDAPEVLRADVAAERERAVADVRRLDTLIEHGLLERVRVSIGRDLAITREHLRAVVAAYRLDDRELRSLLSWREILDEVCDAALETDHEPSFTRPRPLLWLAFRRWWSEYRQSGGRAGRASRRAAWRAVKSDANGAAHALAAWSRHGAAEAARKGEVRLADVLRHPGRVTEELVTLRAVQTLALIDVRNYRSHVWDVGEYGEAGGDPDARLRIEGEDASHVPAPDAAPEGAGAELDTATPV